MALDVGVDRQDLPGALDAFSKAVERRIDMAEVNSRLFLNNVSIGVYGDAVQRPSYRDAKVRTLVETAQLVLGPGARAPAVLLTDDAGREHRQPAVLLVSNNPYALDQPVARGTRPALDTGQLGLWSSTHRPIGRILRREPGPRRTWRWPRPRRCTPGSTAKQPI